MTHRVKMNYPIIADEEQAVSEHYDMIHPNASEKFTVRSAFVSGPDKKVKLTYPASTGRNFDELLRVINSLQLTAQHSVTILANWQDGQDVITAPHVPNAEIESRFPKGHIRIKSYLCTTPQPNN